MKVFRTETGRIIQLADIAKMESWDAGLPLIFIGTINEKQMPNYRKEYPKKTVAEIEHYLNEVLEKVAIPKLINALESQNISERINVAENFVKLSESNPDLLKIALPHIEKATKDTNKQVAELMQKALKNYKKAQKKKLTIEKRKILTELRKNMDKLDDKLALGEITDNEYIIEQKKYLKLKYEITLAENEE